jgi:hypothetical protein
VHEDYNAALVPFGIEILENHDVYPSVFEISEAVQVKPCLCGTPEEIHHYK